MLAVNQIKSLVCRIEPRLARLVRRFDRSLRFIYTRGKVQSEQNKPAENAPHEQEDAQLSAIKETWQEDLYLRLNPDVRRAVEEGAFVSGLAHWLEKGRFEARILPPADNLVPTDSWDENAYLFLYPDVAAAVANSEVASGYIHYITKGHEEKRRLPLPFGPPWLVDEMRQISAIEAALYPTPRLFACASGHSPHGRRHVSICLREILRRARGRTYSHMFLLPWLRRGGADLGALHHIEAVAASGTQSIVVMTTEAVNSPWLSRLPASVHYIDFGEICRQCASSKEQVFIMVRVILAMQPATIHIINSKLGWDVVAAYGSVIRQNSLLFASLYCFDYGTEGETAGYTNALENTWHSFNNIFTDNEEIVRQLICMCGYPAELFKVLPFPACAKLRFGPPKRLFGARPKILWAGRLDRQKRPDIVRDLAQRMPDVDFHVYGAGMLDDAEGASVHNELKALPNVFLGSIFDGFDNIPYDTYLFLLYTSAWDGVPNIILEAYASGLAVIAPDVGGIKEVFGKNSAFLVGDYADVLGYERCIQYAIYHVQELAEERLRAIQHCFDARTVQCFRRRLQTIPGYLKPLSGRAGAAKNTRSFRAIQEVN